MLPLVIAVMSMASGAGGVVVGALWMRKRMTADEKPTECTTSDKRHIWGTWETGNDAGQWWQHRECTACGELQVREASGLS